MKILADEAATMFEEAIGWPYATPGSCDKRGIDCSGLWVRVYRTYGQAIDHGSNSQYRKFCGTTGELTVQTRLRVGMAVFKCRPWVDADRGHGQYGETPGNVYHVGCVTSISPLRIVHATPPAVKADTKLGGWTHWGLLKGVAYEDGESEQTHGRTAQVLPPPMQRNPGPGEATIVGNGVRMRAGVGTRFSVIVTVPEGTILRILGRANGWTQVQYDVRPGLWHTGYIRDDLLKFEEG
jgi:hypothetical protein